LRNYTYVYLQVLVETKNNTNIKDEQTHTTTPEKNKCLQYQEKPKIKVGHPLLDV